DRQTRDVAGLVRALKRQELRVEAGQLTHRSIICGYIRARYGEPEGKAGVPRRGCAQRADALCRRAGGRGQVPGELRLQPGDVRAGPAPRLAATRRELLVVPPEHRPP